MNLNIALFAILNLPCIRMFNLQIRWLALFYLGNGLKLTPLPFTTNTIRFKKDPEALLRLFN